MNVAVLVVQLSAASLVSSGDGGEVHCGHGSCLSEQADHETPPVVLTGSIQV